MMIQASTIPFHIELKELYRQTDRTEHELKFGVVGVDEPAVVIVASHQFDAPAIIEHQSDGGLNLNRRLHDAFALKCYALMASQIIELGGDSGRWTIPDLSTFVQKQFSISDAKRLLEVLSDQLTGNVIVSNVCVVADDDAI